MSDPLNKSTEEEKTAVNETPETTAPEQDKKVSEEKQENPTETVTEETSAVPEEINETAKAVTEPEKSAEAASEEVSGQDESETKEPVEKNTHEASTEDASTSNAETKSESAEVKESSKEQGEPKEAPVSAKISEEKVQEEETEEKAAKAAVEGTTKSKEAKKEESEPAVFDERKISPDPDFDWDELEKGREEYDEKKKAEYLSLYDETLSTIAPNEVVEGTVISMNKREIVVNIGYKSEGVVSFNEFRYNPDLKVGDKVEVYVENPEDAKGQLLLSHKKARMLRAWDRVNEAYANDEIIKGYIKCRTKGGMIVDVFGIESFLPGSQIDVKPIRDYDMFVGKTMEFKVVKINPEFKNVVVSHKALIEAELEQQKKEIIAKLEKGQVLEGTVKNITSYGAFIDLGGVDGLIHITDLSWGRVNHPQEVVQLDEKLNVVILDFDDEKKRIALGLKQLTPHPWDSLDENLKVGDKVKGKVVVIADYGAFVEIAPGVEGLIHVSEMSWSQHLRSAQDFLNVGDEVEAVILTLDREERKMSLGMKQLRPDPWEEIEKRYPVDSRHKAKVRNFTNYGVFVELEEGIDGLIHISDLSWTKKIKHPSEFVTVGDEIEVVVLEIDKDNRRLSLGHKQLEENPWDVFESVFTVGSVHEGTITEITDKGAVVALQYGVEGFATPKHLVKEDKSKAREDEKLPFKVLDFNKGGKKIVVSHSQVWEDKIKGVKQTEVKETQKATRRVKSKLEKTTFGDIADLAALKSEMEEEASKEKEKKAKDEKK